MNTINQAVYIPGTTVYRFGTNQGPNLPITGAPSDTDWSRLSMLHDGRDYRMYFFKENTNNTLYQFAWDGSSYKYGHNSNPELTITGIPDDADTSSFSMVYGDREYRLYFHQIGNPNQIYQFLWDSQRYSPISDSKYFKLQVSGFPDDTDWSRWSILNDGSDYRIYAFKLGGNDQLYQGAWNGSEYKYGYNSSNMSVEDTLANSNSASFDMLNDGRDYRLYMQAMWASMT